MDIKKFSDSYKFTCRTKADVWYLWLLIPMGGIVSGLSYRTFEGYSGKKALDGEVKEKRRFYLTLEVEKKSISKDRQALRLIGPLRSDAFSKRKYHSFEIEVGSTLKLHQSSPLTLLQQKIIQKGNEMRYSFLVVIISNLELKIFDFFDNKSSFIFKYQREPQKRYYNASLDSYEEVALEKIREFIERYKKPYILAGPSGLKEKFISLSPFKIITTKSEGSQALKEVLMTKNLQNSFFYGVLLSKFESSLHERDFISGDEAIEKLKNQEFVESIFISEERISDESFYLILQDYLLIFNPNLYLCDVGSEVDKRLRNFQGIIII